MGEAALSIPPPPWPVETEAGHAHKRAAIQNCEKRKTAFGKALGPAAPQTEQAIIDRNQELVEALYVQLTPECKP